MKMEPVSSISETISASISGVDVMFDALACYFCSYRICLLLPHPQSCEGTVRNVRWYWDGAPVTTSLHPLFPQQSMMWQLRADSVSVITVCSCVKHHISLWWWRQSQPSRHLKPASSSQSWSSEGIIPLRIKIVSLGTTSHQNIFQARAFGGVYCVSVTSNEQWDCLTSFRFCIKLDWNMIPKFPRCWDKSDRQNRRLLNHS
jgi:hypothetical protein